MSEEKPKKSYTVILLMVLATVCLLWLELMIAKLTLLNSSLNTISLFAGTIGLAMVIIVTLFEFPVFFMRQWNSKILKK